MKGDSMDYIGKLPDPTSEDLVRWKQMQAEADQRAKAQQAQRQAEYRAGVEQSLADAQRMIENTLRPDADPIVKGIVLAAVTGFLSLQYTSLFSTMPSFVAAPFTPSSNMKLGL